MGAEKVVTSLKFWEDMLGKSKSGWLLGGLEDGGSEDICFVDLQLWWTLRPHAAKLNECGFEKLASFLEKIASLPGVVRLLESGRMMPHMVEGYVYVGDDLVRKPVD